MKDLISNIPFREDCEKLLHKKIKKDIRNQIDKVFQKSKTRGKYVKIAEEKKNLLSEFFAKNPYPKKSEYEDLAAQLSEPVAKVENWFKHERRSKLDNNDAIKKNYKKRRLLSPEEEEFLESMFRENPNPASRKLISIAQSLNFKVKVISNWFSYRRSKLMKLSDPNVKPVMNSHSLCKKTSVYLQKKREMPTDHSDANDTEIFNSGDEKEEDLDNTREDTLQSPEKSIHQKQSKNVLETSCKSTQEEKAKDTTQILKQESSETTLPKTPFQSSNNQPMVTPIFVLVPVNSNQFMGNNQMPTQITNPMTNTNSNPMSNPMNNQMSNPMNNQMCNQMGNQMCNQMNNQMGTQMNNQMGTQMNNQMGNQMNNQMGNQMANQMSNQMANQMNNQQRVNRPNFGSFPQCGPFQNLHVPNMQGYGCQNGCQNMASYGQNMQSYGQGMGYGQNMSMYGQNQTNFTQMNNYPKNMQNYPSNMQNMQNFPQTMPQYGQNVQNMANFNQNVPNYAQNMSSFNQNYNGYQPRFNGMPFTAQKSCLYQ